MKKHILESALAVLGIGLLASACDSSASYYSGTGDGCNQLTTCATCTPVSGCGWCQTGLGQGLCASRPDECAGAKEFSWTWEPSGCFAPADASVSPPRDSGAPDASPAPDSGAPGADSGSSSSDAEATD